MSPERLAHYMAGELRGIKCRCCSVKRPGETFCKACYFLLTPELRKALYRRIGRGYEQAYTAAVIHLAAKMRFSLPLWIDPPLENDAGAVLPWNLDPPPPRCPTPGCLGAPGHAGSCDVPFS